MSQSQPLQPCTGCQALQHDVEVHAGRQAAQTETFQRFQSAQMLKPLGRHRWTVCEHTHTHTYRQVGAEVCGLCSIQDVCTHMVLGGVCTGLWPVPTSQRWTRSCSPRRSEVTAGVRRGVLRDCLSSRTVSASGHTAHHYNITTLCSMYRHITTLRMTLLQRMTTETYDV